MKKQSKEFRLLLVFAAIFIAMSIISPDRFFSLNNLQSMAFQLPELGIMSLAMMVIIVTSGINLSITSTAALSGIVGAFVLSSYKTTFGGNEVLAVIAAIVACLLVSLICGAINGSIVAYIGVSPILVTIGTMTLFEGISLKFTKGGAISGFPDAFMWFGNDTILGVPVPMIIFVLVIIGVTIKLEYTPWGQGVYMIGCNPVATEFSGINVKKVLMKVYLLSGLLCGIASIVMISRYNSAKVDYGSSYMLQSISAAVLGGTAIEGGYGKVIGTVIATAILQVLSSGLNIIGINRYIVDISMGVILISVLTINFFATRRKEAKEKQKMISKASQSKAV
ncbi:ABC transporter permease [Clostridium aestuarii]|uniref:ABC transporter permease n=1 Tax=Clostridium aestuarii TaxID=338193 RepID=A0ABT4D305_9CLOT|nr:ABC transporter permease [Clostridium aestuarii]MCY6484670.1 ABC transporter permease [Clostridium aestuarii]